MPSKELIKILDGIRKVFGFCDYLLRGQFYLGIIGMNAENLNFFYCRLRQLLPFHLML